MSVKQCAQCDRNYEAPDVCRACDPATRLSRAVSTALGGAIIGVAFGGGLIGMLLGGIAGWWYGWTLRQEKTDAAKEGRP